MPHFLNLDRYSMTALPPADYMQIGNMEPDTLSAYNVCLDFERDTKIDNDAIRARVLGYLILYSPSIHAHHEVIKVIHSCAQNYDALSELGQSFIEYFIHPCNLFTVLQGKRSWNALPVKQLQGHTPVSESHSSRSSFDKDKMDWMVQIEEAPRDHKTAKAQVGYSPFA